MNLRLHALHALAWGALLVASPLAAKRVVDVVAFRLGPSLQPDEAVRAARSLRGGTCLSRSLTLAACLRRAEVVIGVDPTTLPLAHAWVELDGRPLASEAPRGSVIARLGATGPSRRGRGRGPRRPPR